VRSSASSPRFLLEPGWFRWTFAARGSARRWLDLEASKRENGLGLTTPMFIDTARRMARLARIIGQESDADRFLKMADESTTAWAAQFLDPATGKVGSGRYRFATSR